MPSSQTPVTPPFGRSQGREQYGDWLLLLLQYVFTLSVLSGTFLTVGGERNYSFGGEHLIEKLKLIVTSNLLSEK